MTIPTGLRAPIMAIEFDPSRAFQGPAILQHEALLIGNRLTAGTVLTDVIYQATSADEVAEKSGEGSVLHVMAQAWFRNNKLNPAFFVGQDDDVAAVAATGTVVFSGAATAAGVVSLYIAGRLISAAVAVTDDATTVGDAVAAAVTAETDLLVSAANATGTVTFTARNKGELGNDIDLRLNYNDGDVLPAGITAVVTGMGVIAGATNPDIQDIIDILGDKWYQAFVCPYVDATNLTAIETELTDRFGPIRMVDGVYYTAKPGTLGDLGTFGNGRNSPHVTCPEATDVISTPLELAAAYAGQIVAEASADPARPYQTLELLGIIPAPVTEQFTYTERNTLLFDGIATINVDSGGKVRIERAITMYQKNAVAADDIAYLDLTTMLTLMYLRYDFRNSILTRYPRAKLANDGVRVAPGQQVITPKVGKGEALAKFRQWESLGLVENFEQFKNDLVCQRALGDPNRLEWILPPDLVNQFRIGGATIQFLLESPAV